MLVLGIILSIGLATISTFTNLTTQTNNTNLSADQTLPIANNLARYFRGAVEPGPGQAFVQVASATQFEFTTNDGDPLGPDQVCAGLSSSCGGTGPHSSSTFTLTLTAPSGCPLASNSYTGTCSYSYPGVVTHTIASVTNVKSLVFDYLPLDDPPSSAPPVTSCTATWASVSSWPPLPLSSPWTSTPTSSWCWVPVPLDQVWAMYFDLEVQPSPGVAASRQTSAFLFSPTSYEYVKGVG
jgi:hypothetical protein